MRLRLVVRRHNLPDAAVIWAVEPSENPTISQLLEQVNEVIPLESGGDWGLEDYSVEIKGCDANFECLHFQLVRTVLHDDDEILIRPLLSQDLKLRKVSGRHQISSDGRHLYDGWVFGRPRPRGPVDRPAVEIPPRKRRRITHYEDVDSSLDEDPFAIEGQALVENDPDGNRQLTLSADFDDDDDEEDDEDFEPDDDEEEEEDDDDDDESPEEVQSKRYDRADVNGLEIYPIDEEIPEKSHNADPSSEVEKLREVFPNAPLSVCKNVLDGCGREVGKAWDTLSQVFKPSMPRKATSRLFQDHETLTLVKPRSRIKASSKNRKSSLVVHGNALDMGSEGGEPHPVDEDNSLLQYYDRHGLPEGSISNGKALSHMAKIVSSSLPEQSDELSAQNSTRRISTSGDRSTRSVRFSEDGIVVMTSNLLAQDDGNDSDDGEFDLESSVIEPDVSDDSSEESSDSDKDEEKNDVEPTSSEGSDASSSDSTSSSGSDSDSDSDQEPEEVSSRPTALGETVASKISSPAKAPPKDQSTQQRRTVPPGQGKSSTRNRNQRRRVANLLQRYKDKGILPAGTTVQEMKELELDKARISEVALETAADPRLEDSQTPKALTERAAAKAAEFEMRRQQLLNSLASGGIEIGADSPSESLITTPLDPVSNQAGTSDTSCVSAAGDYEAPLIAATDKVPESVDTAGAEPEATSLNPDIAITPIDQHTQAPLVSTESSTAELASRPRRKLDLGATGRLLFSALGVRAPKNKADHEKVRKDLMKDIRPSRPVPTAEAATAETESPILDEDPEAWREVINLRAVECCHNGVELSPAPFPFVQRWDPQQQGSYTKQGNRGGKGKRSQRNQSQYYEDEQQSSTKRKRSRNSYDTYYDSNENLPGADAAEIEDCNRNDEAARRGSGNANSTQITSSDSMDGAVNDQIMKDVQEAATSQAMDEDDLPGLPEDISILPNFTNDDIKPGMVIAFKQLILSEATKWQPQISIYRTAVIIKSSNNGDLELRLARRDREQMEKYFDDETGERIYGRFDMPTDDDHGEGDDGFLEVTINEIIEPKIVQLAPESLSAQSCSPVAAQNKANVSTDDSTTVGNADSLNTSKSSGEATHKADEDDTGHQDLTMGEPGSPAIAIRGGDFSAADDPDKILPLSISEDTREEISVLIKEAGFRTSIPSSVLRAQTQLPVTPRGASDRRSYSPRFNGLDSSPSQPIQAISSPSNFNSTTILMDDEHNAARSGEDVMESKSTTSNVQYPKISVPSSLASQVSDRGRQPDYPISGDDALHQFDELDSFLGVHEESPLIRDQSLLSARSLNVSDDFLMNHVESSPPEFLESSSSDALPNLADVFSTSRSSVGLKLEKQPWQSQKTVVKDAKKIEDSYNREMAALDARLEEAEDTEQITPKASPDRRKKQPPAAAVRRKESGSQFEIPPGSQQVDLTLSSDIEPGAEKEAVSDDSYDDDYSLPRGPGWVGKKTRRTRRQTAGNSQTSSQRVIKTRAARRKTVAKF